MHRVFVNLVLASLAFGGCASEPEEPLEVLDPAPVTFDRLLSPAQMDEYHPLTEAMRAGLTPESLQGLPQWQIDQIYARLDSGPTPEGTWQGSFFVPEGGPDTLAQEATTLDLSLETGALVCGQSLHDAHKPSLVADSAEASSLDSYADQIDWLDATVEAPIRDEIRRVRPGLYVGVGVADGRPTLVFTLFNEKAQRTQDRNSDNCSSQSNAFERKDVP